MSITLSIIIATLIYVLYNVVSVKIFGVPESLSNTYYLYKEKWGFGFLFPIMMLLVVGFMMPAWIVLSEGSVFQFLSFLAPACLVFVGTAPAFKTYGLENKVHSYSAYIAAACSLLWVVLVTHLWWVIPIWIGIIGLLSLSSKTLKSCLVYWLEQIAFGSTFTAAILFSLI